MSGAIVAIDGPAGAGKSTCARRLAHRLGYVLIDTGALYRAVALAARERDISWDDEAALGRLTSELKLRFEPPTEPGGRPPISIDGVDRSGDIRTPEISQGASKVSAYPAVRAALLGVQRAMGRDGGVVLEGRDIGTVVFPDAHVKVFLTASTMARAQRRHEELSAKGSLVALDSVRAGIEERDARDSGRDVAPLRAADDAIVLDSTQMDLDEVLERLVGIVREAGFSTR